MKRIPEVWPGWQAVELIGRGAYGKVYKAARADGGHTSYSAVKIVEIPRDEAETDALRSMGMDALSIRSYYEETARSVMGEIAVMDELKGAPGVLHIEDYALLEREGVGWTILIRMELLEALPSYVAREGAPGAREAARIGADLCRGLSSCHARGVIHRDVKPQNVFRTAYGEYKLGDFGLSRRLDEGSRSTMSRAGTDDFMAPEVEGGHYDLTVDVYSLGIMLYRWLNAGRPPFIGAGEAPTRAAIDEARRKRLTGARPPLPAGEGADPVLAAVVRRAVEPAPADRWQSADAFGGALEAWLGGEAVDMPAEMPEPVRGADLHAQLALTPEEAAAGCTATVELGGPNARGRTAESVAVPAGARDGQAFTYAGLGALGSHGGGAGDLVVHVRVTAPEPEMVPESEPKPDLSRRLPLSRRALIAGAGVGALAVIAIAVGLTNCGGTGGSRASSAVGGWGGVGGSKTEEASSASTNAGSTSVRTTTSNAKITAISTSSTNSNTVGLRSDGTIVDTNCAMYNYNENYDGIDILSWTDITAVSAGEYHVVGLRSDGTAVAVPYYKDYDEGQCDVSDWTDLVAVSAGGLHTIGLRKDGTAVAAGNNDEGQCDVSDWSDLVAVSAGWRYTIGLCKDGTAVAAGNNHYGALDISGWTDLVAVSAGVNHTVGLRSDGTAVAAGSNDHGALDVSGWTDLVAISAGRLHTVGLRSDGTAVAAGHNGSGECNVSGWSDLVAISAGDERTAGLHANGKVVAVGRKSQGGDGSDW